MSATVEGQRPQGWSHSPGHPSAKRGAAFLDRQIAMRHAGSATPRPRLPANGRMIVELRKQGLEPTGWLLVSRDWRDLSCKWTAIVPGPEDPSRFSFDFLSGLPVAVKCSSCDLGNAVLVGMIEAAGPAYGSNVCVDGEFSLWLGERA